MIKLKDISSEYTLIYDEFSQTLYRYNTSESTYTLKYIKRVILSEYMLGQREYELVQKYLSMNRIINDSEIKMIRNKMWPNRVLHHTKYTEALKFVVSMYLNSFVKNINISHYVHFVYSSRIFCC
eukprot:GHVR01181663.1.p1 GENE.GHVR01181663.1~~GHVR01181663.1.p1  ORF type:complete len:125 (+),score=1.34 GHVR01181663.1:407-781(+)